RGGQTLVNATSAQAASGRLSGSSRRPADLVEMLLQRKPTQPFERQVHENADALVERAACSRRRQTPSRHRCLSPWRGLARPNAPSLVAKSSLGASGFANSFQDFERRPETSHLAQQIERERIDRAGRLAAGAIGAKFSSPFSISLGYDRARGVASAEEQYVQGFDGALGLHEVSSSFVACSLRSGGLDEQYSVTIDRNSDSSPRQTN